MKGMKLQKFAQQYINSTNNSNWIENYFIDNFHDLCNNYSVGVDFLYDDIKFYLLNNGFSGASEGNYINYVEKDNNFKKGGAYKIFFNKDFDVLVILEYVKKSNDSIILDASSFQITKTNNVYNLHFFYLSKHNSYVENIVNDILFNNKINRYKYQEENNIYVVVSTNGELSLKQFQLKKTEINIDLNYNDDFNKINEIVIDKLNSGKALCLFHGDPGCGKTNYIKYLTTKINRKMIFLPPNMSNELSSPNFISLLIDNKDSILVIEDAENVLKKRSSQNSNQAISNILNVSDGLLSDILNIGIIATFNCDYKMIDDALERKGRLTAKYEFKKLKKEKAQVLSDKLGFETIIDKDMSLAEIYNQNDLSFTEERKTIGFYNN